MEGLRTHHPRLAAHEKLIVVVAPKRTELPFDVRTRHVLPLGETQDGGDAHVELLQLMAGLRGIRG